MSAARGPAATLRRIVVVARGTLRDLGKGCGGAVAILLAVFLLAMGGEPAGETREQAIRVAVQGRVLSFAIFAALVALVTAVWSVGEDRRSRRLAAWMATPLRAGEYVTGKVLGACVGCLLAVWPLQLLALAAWTLGPDLDFSPQVRQAPVRAELWRAGAVVPWQEDAVMLRPGDRVRLEFPSAGPALRLSMVGVAYERADVPGQPPSAPPHLRVTTASGTVLVDEGLPQLPGIGAQVALPAEASGALVAELDVGVYSGGIILRRQDAVVLGAARPLWTAWGRSLAGVGWLVFLATGLATASALFVSDVLALLGVGVLLLISFARELLVEVTGFVAELHDHDADAWVRQVARVAHACLQGIPQSGSLVGADVLSGSVVPYSAGDPASGGLAMLWVILAVGAASLWLSRARRSLP